MQVHCSSCVINMYICIVERMMPPERYHIVIHRPCEYVTFRGKKYFVDVMKQLEMDRLSWIILVVTWSCAINHKGPFNEWGKRVEVRKGYGSRGWGLLLCKWRKRPCAKECGLPLEAGKSKETEASKRKAVLPTPWLQPCNTRFGPLPSRTVRYICVLSH